MAPIQSIPLGSRSNLTTQGDSHSVSTIYHGETTTDAAEPFIHIGKWKRSKKSKHTKTTPKDDCVSSTRSTPKKTIITVPITISNWDTTTLEINPFDAPTSIEIISIGEIQASSSTSLDPIITNDSSTTPTTSTDLSTSTTSTTNIQTTPVSSISSISSSIYSTSSSTSSAVSPLSTSGSAPSLSTSTTITTSASTSTPTAVNITNASDNPSVSNIQNHGSMPASIIAASVSIGILLLCIIAALLYRRHIIKGREKRRLDVQEYYRRLLGRLDVQQTSTTSLNTMIKVYSKNTGSNHSQSNPTPTEQ